MYTSSKERLADLRRKVYGVECPVYPRRPITDRGNVLHFANYQAAWRLCAKCSRRMIQRKDNSDVCGHCRRELKRDNNSVG
jgi:hypothetical protein